MKWLLYIVGGLALLIGIVAAIGAMLPKGHIAARSIRLRRSPAEIWRMLTDVGAYPSWRKDLSSVEILDGEAGRLLWRETSRHGAISMRMEEVSPERRMVTRIVGDRLPFGGYWVWELRPDGDGTLVTVTEHGEVYNPIFRFMSRFILGHGATMEAYLRDLAAALGDTARPVPAEPAA